MRTDEAREPEALPSIMEEPCDTALIEPVADENAPADEPTPSPRTAEYYKKRPCSEYVYDAALIVGKYLAK